MANEVVEYGCTVIPILSARGAYPSYQVVNMRTPIDWHMIPDEDDPICLKANNAIGSMNRFFLIAF